MASTEVFENQLARLKPWPEVDEVAVSEVAVSDDRRRRGCWRSDLTSSTQHKADVSPTATAIAIAGVMTGPSRRKILCNAAFERILSMGRPMGRARSLIIQAGCENVPHHPMRHLPT
ncbi:hypothetical protein [Bradyrhizobium sp. HKCCYLR20261]|uniref:hypothetical protein n=1 Tax=unclassified Bradyrhizobium TaxID=2631580 RepID=UPI003EBA6BF5